MNFHHFCTYFDRNYLLKGLALHRSLCNVAGDFVLWVLCLDQETQDILAQLAAPQIQIVTLSELEQWEPRLPAVRPDRTLIEYYWTSTPTWITYVMSRVPEGEVVSYLDADLFFFGSLSPIFEEMGRAAVLIHEHRFDRQHLALTETSGIYNVGLVAFRNDSFGWQAARWWQTACLGACYGRPEQGYFGDQKYLDDWPQRFTGVQVLQNVGAGLAPWNVANYKYHDDRGTLRVNGTPLIFFHFHGFRQVAPHIYMQRVFNIPRAVRRHIYWPYIRAVEARMDEVRKVCSSFEMSPAWPTWTRLVRDILRGRAFWNWR